MRYFQMAEFEDFIQTCALLKLEWKGSPYTWFNKRFGDQTIQQRRALVSIDWQECFPQAQIIHESLLVLDHHPLLLLLDAYFGKSKLTHRQCSTIIQHA